MYKWGIRTSVTEVSHISLSKDTCIKSCSNFFKHISTDKRNNKANYLIHTLPSIKIHKHSRWYERDCIYEILDILKNNNLALLAVFVEKFSEGPEKVIYKK